jgi:hypothetical protein
VGGANNTHSDRYIEQRVYTHVHNIIHNLWTNPHPLQSTKPHTSRNAYRYLAGGRPRHTTGHRGGCLAWGGCRSVCWRGCVRLDHATRPLPHTGTRSATGPRAAECIGRGVSPTLWCCCAGVVFDVVALGNGEGPPAGVAGGPSICAPGGAVGVLG